MSPTATRSSNVQEEFSKLLQQYPYTEWLQRFEVIPGSGVFTPGFSDVTTASYNRTFSTLQVDPQCFRGKRILDIGTNGGALAFYLEEIGAEVLAIDIAEPHRYGFSFVHQMRRSHVEFRRLSVYELSPIELGTFDIIMFFGVFYHLKHPLLALERINSVLADGGMMLGNGTVSDGWYHDDADERCDKGVAMHAVTSERIGDEKILSVPSLASLSLCGFSTGQFMRDPSNWFIPNTACFTAWLKSSGFQLEKENTYIYPIKRDWNSHGVFTSSLTFKAVKTGPPQAENDKDPNHYFPTRVELQQALDRIQVLEEQLRQREAQS